MADVVKLKKKNGRPPGSGVPGRAKGTPNKMNRIIRECILMAAEEAGDMVEYTAGEGNLVRIKYRCGSGGLKGYLVWLAKNEPRTFAHLLGRVLPLQVVPVDLPPGTDLSRDDVVRELIQRGIPVNKIFSRPLPPLIDARKTGAKKYEAD